ncbi:MAG TPA: CorA family divalent cation transporter [Opitutaceae bacterium]|nr:CorA family divalent cation transporter [Opitutaceae bacterium]
MLRTEFPFTIKSWPQRLLAIALGEAFLGFLAIVATALALFPMLFAVNPGVAATLDAAQWCIIGWFALEYVVAFAFSRAKRAFLLSPWRLVDFATVLIPLIALLPNVSRALLSSPVLRLIRLTRLVTLGVRASGVAVRHRHDLRSEQKASGPAQITLVADAPVYTPTPSSWEDLLQWLRQPGREWFHVANPNPDELAQIAAAAGLPPGFLETHLFGTSYPHFAPARGFAGLFLWVPEFHPDSRVERHGILLVASEHSLLSISRRPTRLIEKMNVPAAPGDEKAPFAARMIGLLLEHVMRQNERLVDAFEQELRSLEDVPVRESRPGFFERAFRVKRELSAAQADLWRLKSVLAELGDGRARLPGVAAEESDELRRLATRAEYLYETIVNTREEVLSVMELHLNIVSFDMNRVMRVLAVVSVLGLIPAVIGGLFGMNLIDNPWPFTLPQVAFVISFGMLTCLYFFFVKGWLR